MDRRARQMPSRSWRFFTKLGVMPAQLKTPRTTSASYVHGFTMWSAFEKVVRGCAIAEQGHHQEGIAQIEEGIAAYRAAGADFGTANYLNHLAQICIGMGDLDKASNALSELMALQNAGQDSVAERVETLRLKGDLLLTL